MGFKDLVKQNLEQLENPQSTKAKFNESLSGAHTLNKSKVQKGQFIYENKLIDETGKVLKTLPFEYLTKIHNDTVFGLTRYEEGPWGAKGKHNWLKNVPNHHELQIHNNTIYTFGKDVQKYKGRLVEFDAVEQYDLEGKLLWRWSSWVNLKQLQKHHAKLTLDIPKIPLIKEKAMRNTPSPWGGFYDYYRFNSLQVIPKNKTKFHEGKLLISVRHGSFIFILNQETNNIDWFMGPKELDGNMEGQHSAQILPNGHMRIFDNGRYRGWSRIIEFSPTTKAIVWEYKADNFYSKSQGYVQTLPNGNLLITESEAGRAFQLTTDKEIVWEFHHPDKQNKSNSLHPKSFGKRQWMYRMTTFKSE